MASPNSKFIQEKIASFTEDLTDAVIPYGVSLPLNAGSPNVSSKIDPIVIGIPCPVALQAGTLLVYDPSDLFVHPANYDVYGQLGTFSTDFDVPFIIGIAYQDSQANQTARVMTYGQAFLFSGLTIGQYYFTRTGVENMKASEVLREFDVGLDNILDAVYLKGVSITGNDLLYRM